MVVKNSVRKAHSSEISQFSDVSLAHRKLPGDKFRVNSSSFRVRRAFDCWSYCISIVVVNVVSISVDCCFIRENETGKLR